MDDRRQQPDRRLETRPDRRTRTLSDKVNCPACGWGISVVMPYHYKNSDAGFVRLRKCQDCSATFKTIEVAIIPAIATSSAT